MRISQSPGPDLTPPDRRWWTAFAPSLAMFVILLGTTDVSAQTDRILGRPVQEWFKILHHSPDAGKRQGAAFAIGKVIGNSAVPFRELKKALAAEKSIRMSARPSSFRSAISPISLDRPTSISGLFQALLLAGLTDTDWGVRRSAVYALGHLSFHTDQTFAALDKAREDDHSEVRQNVAWALAKFGKIGVPSLTALLSDKDTVRRESARAFLADLANDPT